MDNGFSKNILGFLEKAIFKEKVYHSGEKRSPGLMSCHFYSLYMLEQASGVFCFQRDSSGKQSLQLILNSQDLNRISLPKIRKACASARVYYDRKENKVTLFLPCSLTLNNTFSPIQ